MTDPAAQSPSLADQLPEWVARQRWYAGKPRVPVLRRVGGRRYPDPTGLAGIDVWLARDAGAPEEGGPAPVYQIPLTYRTAPLDDAPEPALVARLRHPVIGDRWVYDGAYDPAYVAALLDDVLDEPAPYRSHEVLIGEQSNTSIIARLDGADPVIVKLLRTLAAGPHPDAEIPLGLRALDSRDVAVTRGTTETSWLGSDEPGCAAVAQTFLTGARDAWRVALQQCRAGADFADTARALGRLTARLHAQLAFAFGSVAAPDEAQERIRESLTSRYAAAAADAPELAELAEPFAAALADLGAIRWPALQRIHGDFHLGQVLITTDGTLVAIDFEGEPLRPLAERRRPDLPARDVAGMLRSFEYAAATIAREPVADGAAPPRVGSALDPAAWGAGARAAYLQGYAAEGGGGEDAALVRLLELDKALYEVSYEARNRPTWRDLPLAAVRAALGVTAPEVIAPEVIAPEVAVPGGTAAGDPPQTLPSSSETRSDMESDLTPVQAQALVADYTAVDAFLEGRHSQPHDLLGHHVGPGGLTVTCYRPLASSVRAKLQDGTIIDLPHVKGGIWSGTTDAANESQDYRLLVTYGDGFEHEQDDAYRFVPTVGEVDRFLFNEGRHEELWKVLGSQVRSYPGPMGEVSGVSFAVWAPNATAVHVVGDFNGWDRLSHPMRMLAPSGIWELFIPGAAEGMNYQFAIRGKDTVVRLKADPMARFAEVAPKQASVVYESRYEWGDQEWMLARQTSDPHLKPMSIYEVHIGSWRQGLGYLGLAEHLVNYVKDLGFTHVEFLPVTEHPYVPSWGYHVTGYYAVSSRWGTPDEFKQLVDYLHRNDIGVILDWVPGHFATDEWALARFDGHALYEHEDPRKGWHNEWGSFVFDFGRPEVKNFLVANASYWLEEFHIDGLRVDGVASMLYLDYSREPGQWIPNQYGGRENLDAVQVLQESNATAYKRVPGVITVAEESTSWGGVTKPTDQGGLGFGFKWNMGWMNDSLRYIGMDPIYRQWHHNKLTFAMMYAYSENFILPVSHDEVVHGKGSLMRKARGSREDQIATVRAYLAFMWAHPGKQLIFMGSEFAQESEWSEGRSLDWWVTDQPLHYRVHNMVKEMNHVYRGNRAMWELDHDPRGFRWLNADDNASNTFSFIRYGDGDPAVDAPALACVSNFSGSTHEPYRIGLPRGGGWRVALDTAGFYPDAPSSGGLVLQAEPLGWNGLPYAVNVTVPSLSTVWLVPED